MTLHRVARHLPEIPVLREHCRAMAMLEAVLSPEWDDRYHTFDAHWAPGEQLASMRNGSGDEFSIVFSAAGAYIRGFAHESPMSPYVNDGPWPGVLDDVPGVFRAYVEAPAFTDEDGLPLVTACLWRATGDEAWQSGTAVEFPTSDRGDDACGTGTGDDPDGAEYLFRLLVDRSPEAFQEFAEDYYDVPVPLAAVRHVCALRPLTDPVVTALDPDVSLDALAKDIAEIGYPTSA
ncbi:hypothetical protein [Streptomyces sp. ALI-76-A]|jgi:hypothetical protein|uniref:hypothetical protein n=1 Tax=Streptomyces sp. ALI-76-A TaxID=3025736 RepID=UPI00256F13F3|nr:hypothetical protein [Streptomyces sp. ALI-76-A]MDL5202373.1 hypothetical protein [Streptomyces sp. ALI-76-A]